jgi:hypothetical protein
MQVAVEEALPAPQPVDGGADVQLPGFDRVGELVKVEQALVASVDRDQDVDVQVLMVIESWPAVTWTRSTYQVSGPLLARSVPRVDRHAGTDMLTPRSSSTNTRSRSVRPGHGSNLPGSRNSYATVSSERTPGSGPSSGTGSP